MTRVLHIFGAMDRGGAEMRTAALLHVIDRQRYAVGFCTLAGRPGTLDDEIRALGGTLHPCRLDVGFGPRFIALLRRERIDIVHSHVHLVSGLILALARVAGVRRRIAHLRATHDGRGYGMGRRLHRAVMRTLLDRSATQILGVAAGVLEQAWRPDWQQDPRCQVIYNGIDAARFVVPDARASIRAELGLPADAKVVVQVARFDALKNQPFAAEVMAQVPDASVVFIGRAGASLTPTERTLDRLGLRRRSFLLGERSDVARWLAGADLSMLTSTSEGLPGVVLESLAAGTPVVATTLPGVTEIGARVPGVHHHPLAAGPTRWAQTVAAVLAAPRDPQIRERFLASPFSLEVAAAAMTAAWDAAP